MKLSASSLTSLGLTAGALFFAACGNSNGNSEGKIPDAPDAAIQTIAREFADGNGGILWQAMPDSYRDDINEIAQLSGTKFDPELYDKSFALVGRLAEVAKKQKSFIINTELGGTDAEMKARLEEAFPSVVGLLETFAQSSLASVEGLQSFDGQAFFDQTVSQLAGHFKELAKLSDESAASMAEFENLTVTIVEATETEATLEMSVPGEAPEVETFTKVEGRWVPADMAAEWPARMEELRMQLNAMTPEQTAQNKPQIMGALTMFDGVLTQLEAAETQQQFDQALQGAMMPIMGLMMMGQGTGGSQMPAPAPAPMQTPAAP